MYIVLVTTKNGKEADKISNELLKEKLIACANRIDGVKSMFWWQGKISKSKETLLVLKTRKSLYKRLEAKIKSLHSYMVPEIIALDVEAVSKEYMAWIKSSTTVAASAPSNGETNV
jgi:periplasmic divalent cation tolerance protein